MATRPTILPRADWVEHLRGMGEATVSVVWLDVDAFAELREVRGRTEAETLLRGLERTLAAHFPTGSVLGRLGPDEYGVLLPDTSPETALRLTDDLVRRFARHRDPQWPKGVGLSAGIAARPAHAGEAGDLLTAADEALLRAKVEGRGRAALYTPGKMVLKSNYYPRSQLERLKRAARREGRPEADILREALAAYLAGG